jgi:IMP dehydrogenase
MAHPNGTSDIPLGLTFDDVLLQPLESSVLPSQAERNVGGAVGVGHIGP